MTWLAHILGLDTQHSWPYDFWSGCATQASAVAGLVMFWRHKQCHVRWCARVGRHQEQGHLLCHRHHRTGALSAHEARRVGL